MKWHKVLVGFLGFKKNMLVLLTMVILVGLGEKMAERFLPLYLVALGGGAFLWNASASAKLFNLIGIGHGVLPYSIGSGGNCCRLQPAFSRRFGKLRQAV